MTLMIPTTIFGAVNYLRLKLIDVKTVKLLAVPAIIGSIVGAVATNYVQPSVLMILFALYTGIVGLDMCFGIGNKIRSHRLDQVKAGGSQTQAVPASIAVLIGFGVGLSAGFFGVGGGFILVPLLLYFFHSSIRAAFGTSLLIVAAVSIPGAITHAIHHHVDYALASFMVCAAVPGAWLDSFLSVRLKEKWLKGAFGVLLLVIACLLAGREAQSFRAY